MCETVHTIGISGFKGVFWFLLSINIPYYDVDFFYGDDLVVSDDYSNNLFSFYLFICKGVSMGNDTKLRY